MVPSSSRTLLFDYDSEADSECRTPFPGLKDINSTHQILCTQLRYDSNVTQFNNWLVDLKSAFDGDPAKYPTSRQKIILTSMTIDDQTRVTRLWIWLDADFPGLVSLKMFENTLLLVQSVKAKLYIDQNHMASWNLFQIPQTYGTH